MYFQSISSRPRGFSTFSKVISDISDNAKKVLNYSRALDVNINNNNSDFSRGFVDYCQAITFHIAPFAVHIITHAPVFWRLKLSENT